MNIILLLPFKKTIIKNFKKNAEKNCNKRIFKKTLENMETIESEVSVPIFLEFENY
jgi:hypothetical protein